MQARAGSHSLQKNLVGSPTIYQQDSESRVGVAASSRGLAGPGHHDPFGDKMPRAARRAVAGIQLCFDRATQGDILTAECPPAYQPELSHIFVVQDRLDYSLLQPGECHK